MAEHERKRLSAKRLSDMLKASVAEADMKGLDLVLYESVFDPVYLSVLRDLEPAVSGAVKGGEPDETVFESLRHFPARVGRRDGCVHLPASLVLSVEHLIACTGQASAWVALRLAQTATEGRAIWGIAGERAVRAALAVADFGGRGPSGAEIALRFEVQRGARSLGAFEELDEEQTALSTLVLADSYYWKWCNAAAYPNDFVAGWYRSLKRALIMRVCRLGTGWLRILGLKGITDHELILLHHRIRRFMRQRGDGRVSFRGRDRGGDGSSRCEAVFVDRVEEEYEWLKDHLPGFVRVKQYINESGPEPFDVLVVENAQKERRNLYFNISRFYGAHQ